MPVDSSEPPPVAAKPAVEPDPEPEPVKEKTREECTDEYYACMDKKTTEVVMQYEAYYDDYSQMLTDTYSGITNPPFKCIFDDKVKELYGDAYYGIKHLRIRTKPDRTEIGSITFYNSLKQNAIDVSSGKLQPTGLDMSVYDIAKLEVRVDGTEPSPMQYPEVEFKSLVVDPKSEFKGMSEFCSSPRDNKRVEGCTENTLSERELSNKWKNLPPMTVKKSCDDYKAFLADKKKKAKESAESFINTLKMSLGQKIGAYNSNLYAKKRLEEELQDMDVGAEVMKGMR
jgi:hypothetical protein